MTNRIVKINSFPSVELPMNVGEEDFNYGSGNTILKTDGLGPCVGIAIYSPGMKQGVLAHISGFRKVPEHLTKENIVETMLRGMDPHTYLEAYLTGESLNTGDAPRDSVSEIVKKSLRERGINIIGEDLGDVPKGRSMVLHCDTGRVEVYRYV